MRLGLIVGVAVVGCLAGVVWRSHFHNRQAEAMQLMDRHVAELNELRAIVQANPALCYPMEVNSPHPDCATRPKSDAERSTLARLNRLARDVGIRYLSVRFDEHGAPSVIDFEIFPQGLTPNVPEINGAWVRSDRTNVEYVGNPNCRRIHLPDWVVCSGRWIFL